MQLNLVAHFEKTGIGKMSFCKEQKKSAAFATDLFGRGRRTLSPRSTLVGQDGSTMPKGTVFTAVLFSSFCKKRIKKSVAFAADLFGRGRRTLSPRSTLVGQDGSTVPKGTVFTAILFSSFCKKQRKNRLLLQPTFLADPHFRNPNILPKRKNGYFSLDYRKQ